MASIKLYCNGELKTTFSLQKSLTRIGRAADNDVVIDNPGVSLYHASIIRDGSAYYVEDDLSTNGVYVNGERIARARIDYGDDIVINKHILKFSAIDVMPVENAERQQTQAIAENRTVAIDVEQFLVSLKQLQADFPYLMQIGGAGHGKKFVLSKPQCSIGKDADCDIPVGGWFTPKIAAKIAKRSDGYCIFPEKAGRIRLNGAAISKPVKLQPRDNLEIHGATLAYYEPAAEIDSLS